MLHLSVPRALAVLVAALALGGCGNSDDDDNETRGSASGDDPHAAERQACVDRINGFRASEGLPALMRWTEQEACTDEQAANDSRSGEAHGAFGRCQEGAQNECPSWGSVEDVIRDCLQSMWDEGPGEPYAEHGHYLNMSNPDYRKVSCGFHETASGKVWAIQNFR